MRRAERKPSALGIGQVSEFSVQVGDLAVAAKAAGLCAGRHGTWVAKQCAARAWYQAGTSKLTPP
eukprot:4934414-Pyramimonas_sp.AAC.1